MIVGVPEKLIGKITFCNEKDGLVKPLKEVELTEEENMLLEEYRKDLLSARRSRFE